MIRRAMLVVALLAVAVTTHSIEVQEGRIRLVLDEDSSRFLIGFFASDGSELPLIFAEDPFTSWLDIREGNRIYRMGDSGDFRQVVEDKEEGLFYIWTSPTLRVAQRFRFIRSVGGSEVDGVQIDLAITNLGEQTVPVAARLLLDTYLGEQGNEHFSGPLNELITREMEVVPPAGQSFIRSKGADDSDGLQVMLSGGDVTVPVQTAVANWKRLYDSEWPYTVNASRNFNRLPYSINDSALLLTYDEQLLARNERYEIVLQLGGFAPDGYLAPGAPVPQPVEAPTDDRQELLAQVQDLITRIDALLADPSATAEQAAALRAEFEELADKITGQ